jgi:heat-inducible transcriptional repressor
MASKGSNDDLGTLLDARQEAVLRSVIRAHVATGEPVGSQTVTRASKIDLSPASIRNIMAELEERGLLSQPHTSAGRIPTDQAYRFFVDHLISRHRVAAGDAQAIDAALARNRGELADLLEEASRQLSLFSNQVGLVMAPKLRRIIVEHLEFVRLDAHRIVAILVGRSGVVHNRILDVQDSIDQSELDRIGRYLSEEFGGRTLPEMRELLHLRMTEERAKYDELMSRGLDLGRRTVEAGELEAGLFIEGASNLLGFPEFSDLEVVRSLFRTLEEKKTLIDLLSRVLEDTGVQVVIGEENPSPDLAGCSLVASSYGIGNRVIGTLGIVGPTRMEYARAIALVDYLARLLTRLLSSSEN